MSQAKTLSETIQAADYIAASTSLDAKQKLVILGDLYAGLPDPRSMSLGRGTREVTAAHLNSLMEIVHGGNQERLVAARPSGGATEADRGTDTGGSPASPPPARPKTANKRPAKRSASAVQGRDQLGTVGDTDVPSGQPASGASEEGGDGPAEG